MGVAFGTYLTSIFTGISTSAAACIIVTLFFLLNLLDLKTSAKVQNIVTSILLIVLLSFIILGLGKCEYEPALQQGSLLFGGTRGILMRARRFCSVSAAVRSL